MELGLKGKHALITGGSHGIGLATAKSLAGEGCHVAICSRTPERLQKAAKELAGFGVEILTFQTDVLAPGDIDRTLDALFGKWGGVDILINNVGGGSRWDKSSFEEIDEKVWMEVYEKNALAAIRFTRRLVPEMRKRKWGRVVTITSRLGREGRGRPWYSMAKAAQTSLMKTLGMTPELVRDGVTFNSVAPGAIMIPDTGWADEKHRDPKAFEERLKQDFALGRLGTPEEVADAIVFVCSARGSLINGTAIAVDGGESRAF